MSEQETIAEALQVLRLCGGKLSHPMMGKALKLMESASISAPFDPKTKFCLAEFQIFAGRVIEAKISLTESIKLGLCSNPLNISGGASDSWPQIRMKPFSDFSARKYDFCMDFLDRSYRGLIEYGVGDPRIFFYLANLCKLRRDFNGFSFWLDHADITDDFYLKYSMSSGSDAFAVDERCWIQEKFFQRIAEMSPCDSIEDLFAEYYRCLSCDFEPQKSRITPCGSSSQQEDEHITSGEESEESEDLETSEESEYLDESEWLSSQFERAQFFQGYFLREIGDLNSALACFEIAENLCAENSSDLILSAVLLGKARINFEMLNIEESRNLYHRAMQTSMAKKGNERVCLPALFQPSLLLADSFAGLAACDRLLCRLTEAEAWAHQALQYDPACCDAVIQLLYIYLEQRKFTSFEDNFESLIRKSVDSDLKTDKHNLSFRFTKMELHRKIQHAAIQKSDNAIDTLTCAERPSEKIWIILFNMLIQPGMAQLQTEALALAVHKLDKCPYPWNTRTVTGDDDELQTVLAKGKWFMKRLGMITESMSAYTCALHKVKKEQNQDGYIISIKCLWKRHKLFLMTGNAKEALQDLRVGLETLENLTSWPNFLQKKAEIHLARGLIMFKLEDLLSAQQSFIAAIESNPSLACAKGYLGLIYSRMDFNYHERAIDLLKQYLENPNLSDVNPDRTVMLTYAKLLCSTSKSKAEIFEAMNICSRVLDQNAKDMDALLERGGCLMLLGMWEAAIADYTGIITSHTFSGRFISAYYNRGRAHQQMQEYNQALNDFQRADEEGFDDVHLYQNMAFCHEAVGNLQSALKWHDTVLSRNDVNVNERIASLTRKAAVNAALNQDSLAVRDLDCLLKLVPLSINFLFQRACLLSRRLNDTAMSSDPACLPSLRRALDDLDTVLAADPSHLQARIKRALIHTAVYGDMLDDVVLLDMTTTVEKNLFSKSDQCFLCHYAVSLAEEILSNDSMERQFSFIDNRDVASKRFDILVDSTGQVLSRDSKAAPDSPFNVLLGSLQSSQLERRGTEGSMFSFDFRCKSSNYHLVARTLRERERFFQMKQIFSDNGLAQNSKLISIFKFIREVEPNNLISLYYPALLHDRNGEDEEARLWYMAALKNLHYAEKKSFGVQSYSAKCDSVESHCMNTGNQFEENFLFEPIAGRCRANNLRSEICFRLGLLILRKGSQIFQDNKVINAAAKMFELSVRNNEQHWKSLEYLGYLALKLQRVEDAGRWYEALAKIKTQSADVQNNLGVVMEIQGDFSKAMSFYIKANSLEQANLQYLCNMCMLRIRLDQSCASDVIDRMSQLIDVTKLGQANSRYYPYLVRAVAFHIRNSTRGEVHDKEMAVSDYEQVLRIEPTCFQARVMLAHAAITAGNVFRASAHIEWLDCQEPRSQILAELKFLALKIELMYASVLADFIFAVKINPKFFSVDLNSPNVDIKPLKLSLETCMSATDIFGSACADLRTLSAINAIDAAFRTNDMAKVLEETTKLATMCKKNDHLLARALASRALAHAELGKSRSAMEDAQNSLRYLGIHPLSDKKSTVEGQSRSFSNTAVIGTSDSLAYSLLCLLGSTYENCFDTAQGDQCTCGDAVSQVNITNMQEAFERARMCYHTATALIPDRVEAVLNCANLCRKVKCYDECLISYLQVLRCMARDEELICSPLREYQKSLLDIMSEYYSEWKDVIESTVFSSKGIYKTHTLKDLDRLQGDMLWLSKELFRIFRRSQGWAASASFQIARKNLLKVTSKSIKAVCDSPDIFYESEDAARAIYFEYLKSLDHLVDNSDFVIGDKTCVSQDLFTDDELQSFVVPVGEIVEMLRVQSCSEKALFPIDTFTAVRPLAEIFSPHTISKMIDKSERESLLSMK